MGFPPGGPGGPGPRSGPDGKMEVFFNVPSAKCGLVIGKGEHKFFFIANFFWLI